jgi:hypothetical protein
MPQTPELHRGLDPQDWSATLELGHRMLDEMITWLATSRDRPVWRHMPQNLRATLREKLPQGGQDPDAIYEEFRRLILPFSSANEHPRMMGWVNGGGSAAGLLAELLTGIFNVNCGGRDHAAIEVERLVIAWAAEMVGMPAQTTGEPRPGAGCHRHGCGRHAGGCRPAMAPASGHDQRPDHGLCR